MEIQNRYDVFEPEDTTALVCIDEPEVQRTAVEQLGALGYKLHTGLFVEDISVKLKAHVYDVVVIHENFNNSIVEGNPLLAEVVRIPATQRRQQFVVLIGPNLVTNDEMQAFEYSVDLVFSVSDLAVFGQVMRRAYARYKEFYRLFNECVRLAGV